MLTAIIVNNPFDPFLKDAERNVLSGVRTVREALEKLYPGFVEFEYPTICIVNGAPKMRSEWDKRLPDESILTVVRLSQGVAEVIIAAVVIAVAVAAYVMVKTQNQAAIGADKKTQKNGAAVYSLEGQQNQNKLNSPIECCYGRNRIFPAYAAKPYNVYAGNKQYLYALYSLGHGLFNLEDLAVKFGETPISSFYGHYRMEICSPGQTPSFIHPNVNTATTVSGIELFAPNEEQYTSLHPGYDACAPGESCNKIEVDVVLPSGLYKVNPTSGKFDKLEIKATFEARLVDSNSAPLSGWVTLFNFKKKLKTNTPQRFTLSTNVSPGRYQVRARRTNKKDLTVQAGNVIQWEALRGFIPSTPDYGDVTLIAIRAEATNLLNSSSAGQFNVVAKRRLRAWSPSTGWGPPLETRNPVWAFCDVFTSTYGGQLPDTFLDLQSLYELSLYFEDNDINFDYIFSQSSTVWEAATAIALVGRGVPMLTGSQITIIRDDPRSVATAVFNQNNIIAGSFSWGVKLPAVSKNDGIEVSYTDENTWKQETVTALIGTDLGRNVSNLSFPGCTSRDRAFQFGLYTRAVELYNRESIEFKTGLEGHLPLFGDLILVSHDVPQWGSGGYVTDIDGDTITLSNSVTFVPGIIHKLVLRNKDGSSYGPITVTEGSNDKEVIASASFVPDFFSGDQYEQPYYLFGQESIECRRCSVVGIIPQGDDAVLIQCAAYDERVFSYSGVTTPPLFTNNNTPVTDPALPVVGTVTVEGTHGSPGFFTAKWAPALGALSYVVDSSPDGSTWTNVSNTKVASVILPTTGGTLHLRVAGVNTGVGAWSYWTGSTVTDVVPNPIESLNVLTVAPGAVTIVWEAPDGAVSYTVQVIDTATGDVIHSEVVYAEIFSYSRSIGSSEGLSTPSLRFSVVATNSAGSSRATVLDYTLTSADYTPPTITGSVKADNTHVLADSDTITADRN